MKKFILLILVVAILLPMKGFAWDDKKTHPRITEEAVLKSNLNVYLQNNLGFIKSEDPYQPGTLFKGKYVTELIQKGSVLEDDPMCRAGNHFHNPLKDWGTSGLTDTWWPVELWCYGLGLGQYPLPRMRFHPTLPGPPDFCHRTPMIKMMLFVNSTNGTGTAPESTFIPT